MTGIHPRYVAIPVPLLAQRNSVSLQNLHFEHLDLRSQRLPFRRLLVNLLHHIHPLDHFAERREALPVGVSAPPKSSSGVERIAPWNPHLENCITGKSAAPMNHDSHLASKSNLLASFPSRSTIPDVGVSTKSDLWTAGFTAHSLTASVQVSDTFPLAKKRALLNAVG